MNLFRFLSFLLIALIVGCKKDSKESVYDKLDGIWIHYQIKYPDGKLEPASIGSSLFGAYDESVKLNKDLTFLPGSIYLNNTFATDTLEKGVYAYSEIEKTLTLENGITWAYQVVRLDDKELWLSSGVQPTIYYFRRQ